jgi:GntR family transcriptional regulator / MocR family aminotransferase
MTTMFVKSDDTGTLYLRVYESLRRDILEGRLSPGAKLPSTRSLAKDAGVSRTTVLMAYDQLVAEGYIVGRAGSGTFVAPEIPDRRPGESRADGSPPTTALATPRLSAYGRRITGAAVVPPQRRAGARYDFRYGLAPVEEFPHETWRRILARRARVASVRSLQYGPPEGYGPLREAVASYLRRARGVVCGPEHVVVVNGSQQAIDLTTRVLVDPGDAVVVEEPHYQGARKSFLAAGAELVPSPVDTEGLDASTLPAAADSAKLAYVTPSHQFPAGAVMSLARRLELLAWAERAEAYIFEDDYDSEYRYEGRPVEAVQGLDRAGRVIYAGTFSKVMYPALRAGYLVLPEPLVDPFAAAKWLTDRHTPTLEQEALAEFISEGHFERHLRRSRTRNASRRNALLEALHEYLGDRVEISGANAGIHLLVWLRDVAPEDVEALIERAARASVGIYSVNPYYVTPPSRAGFVLGYASLSEKEIRAGVRVLAAVV